jgi:hypothetical protein
MSNDIKTIENSFVIAMGSGVAATGHLIDLIQSVVKSGQGGVLASAIARLNKKGDAQGSRAVRSITAAVFVGAKVSTAKDKKTLLVSLKDAIVDTDALARLVDAGGEKLSIRDALVKRVKGAATTMTKTDADKLAKTYVAATHKRVDGGACTMLENVTAMRNALKALEAELAADAKALAAKAA